MRDAEEQAAQQVFAEHEVLAREADETGQPVHECGSLDHPCEFVVDRSHALGVALWNCSCPQCLRLNAERGEPA